MQRYSSAEVDLFASEETTYCPLWFALTPLAPLRLDTMEQVWLSLCLYAFPLIALFPAILARVGQDRVHLLLVASSLVCGPPRRSCSREIFSLKCRG